MATVEIQRETPAWKGARLLKLTERSRTALEQLALVPGVHGACICDNRGAILGVLLAGTGDRSLYEHVALALTQCLAALERRSPIQEIELRFQRNLLVARDLGNALVVIICSPAVNPSLLRMALNVGTSPFQSDAALQESLARIAPSRAHTLGPEHLNAEDHALLRRAGLGLA
jgi:hypothetical protein